MPTALKLAEKIGRNGPLAVRTAKQIVVRALNLEPGLVLEKALGAKVLASDDARHVTGEVVNVSGGVSLRP